MEVKQSDHCNYATAKYNASLTHGGFRDRRLPSLSELDMRAV